MLRILPMLVVAALALTAVGPLFDGRMVVGHDAYEHATRTAEYARAVGSGVWWPEWAPNLGHGYGEPVFLFNPPLFYALAAIPTFVGAPIVSAVNLATAFLLVVAGLGAYAWTARVFGRIGGLVAGVAYAWSPYVLLDLYVRQALTELAAVCVFPWALWGLARTCQTPGSRRLAVAAVAVGLLLLASTPAAVVIAPALLGQVAVLTRLRRPLGLARGLAALALGGLLAAAFWAPAASERHLLRFDRLLSDRPAYYNHFLEPTQLLSPAWGYGLSVPGPEDGMGFGLGRANLLLAACAVGLLVAGRARGLLGRQAWLAIALAAGGVVLTTEWSAPVWERLPELRYLQFPWRFLLLPALGGAALAAVPAALLARSRPRAAVLLALACAAVLVVEGWSRARPGDLATVPGTEFAPPAIANRDRARGTAYEYETIWTEGRPEESARARLVTRTGSATIIDLDADAHRERFAVAARGRVRLRLNTFYFPGWRVYVDGREQPIDYANPSGLIELVVERGQHLIEARFEPTPARRLGRALSAVALGVVALMLIWTGRRPRRPSGHRGGGDSPLDGRIAELRPPIRLLPASPKAAGRRPA